MTKLKDWLVAGAVLLVGRRPAKPERVEPRIVARGAPDRRAENLVLVLFGLATVAAAAFIRCAGIDLYTAHSMLAIAPAIVCFWAAMLRKALGSWTRMYFSLLAGALLATLIFREVSGSVLTIAWGVEGVALLAAGFPLRDRASCCSRARERPARSGSRR